MKVQYFDDTDTLYIEFQGREITETRDLDENTILIWMRREMSALSPLSMPAHVQMSTICT